MVPNRRRSLLQMSLIRIEKILIPSVEVCFLFLKRKQYTPRGLWPMLSCIYDIMLYYHFYMVPYLNSTMSIWYHVYMVPHLYGTMSIWYHVYIVPCLYGTMSIWYHVYTMPCLYGTMSIWNGIIQKWYHIDAEVLLQMALIRIEKIMIPSVEVYFLF